ncbi:MAG: hypothetical protein RL681_666 [Candidatus Parcubacteria bacterium]|jgi:uncharacterized membrane protein (UPF0127 family)
MEGMKRKTAISATILGVLIILGYYVFGIRPKSDYGQATVLLGGQEFRTDIADTADKQAIGLSGRPSLGQDEGMLFVFGGYASRTFWMPDMNFPIDIIWIKDDVVVGSAENAQPEPGVSMFRLKRYSSPGPVDKVFEVSAGTVSRLGVKVGDRIVVSGV